MRYLTDRCAVPAGALRRIGRFAAAGFVAFLGYSAVMWFVTSRLGFGQIVGACGGFIVGTVISYVGNSLWVFAQRQTIGNAFRFWIVTAAGMVANVALAGLLERSGMPPAGTVIVIFATVPMLNYIGHHVWTFRNRPEARRDDASRSAQLR